MRLKQVAMGLVILAVGAVFIVPPLLAPDYVVRQGLFMAKVQASASGMGMAGRPILRAQVEDETGRRFWIDMPSASIVAPGTPVQIEVWCETDAHLNCAARHMR